MRAYRALRRFDAERMRALRVQAVAHHHHAQPVAQPPALGRPPTTDRRTHPAGRRRPRPRARGRPAEDNADARALVAPPGASCREHHRVPVVLRHVVGLSYAEIACRASCPVGTAKANVARGLAALRELARTPAAPPARPAAARSTSPRHARRRVTSPVPEEVS